MAAKQAVASCGLVLLLLVGSTYGAFEMVNAPFGVVSTGDATFYGDPQGGGVDGGNCGYLGLRRNLGSLKHQTYGLHISAASYPLWQDGAGCGACYKVKCVNSEFCLDTELVVTITDFCPDEGWCDAWKYHFDLGGAAFPKLAKVQAGHFPLTYERVPCPREGPIVLRVMGNPFWLSVLSENVGGAGTTDAIEIQTPENPDWISMTHDWGGFFKVSGQSFPGPLSVRLTQKLTGEQVVLKNCIPANWVPNTEYTCDANFGGGTTTAAADVIPSTPAAMIPEQPQIPEPIVIQIPIATDAPTPVPTDPQTPAPTDPQTSTPTIPQTPPPTDPQTPTPTNPQIPAPTDAQIPVPTDPQIPVPTIPQTPSPTIPQTPAPTDPQTPTPTIPQLPAPTDPQIPAPTDPQTPVPTAAQTPAPQTTEAQTPSPNSVIASVASTGSPTDAPVPIVTAPTPVKTTILEDPTEAADVTGASCISWAQGQSHRRLLDSSTVQLCTKVISEWTENNGTAQIAQYQLNLINNGNAPLTRITMGLTNFKPWYDQYWKFAYNNVTQTASLPDWQVPLPSGQTFDFGYIQAGASGATFSIQDVQFAALAKRRSR